MIGLMALYGEYNGIIPDLILLKIFLIVDFVDISIVWIEKQGV